MASGNPCGPRARWAAAWGSGWATCCSACSAAGATMERPRFPRGSGDERSKGNEPGATGRAGPGLDEYGRTCQGGSDDERHEWIELPWADDGLGDRWLPA